MPSYVGQSETPVSNRTESSYSIANAVLTRSMEQSRSYNVDDAETTGVTFIIL